MGGFIEGLGAFGASILVLALETGILVGAAYVGVYVSGRQRSTWQGWVAGFLTVVLLFLFLMPSIENLREMSCKNSEDFDACMEGPVE